MWKYLFSFLNFMSYFLIIPRVVRWFQTQKLFDYKRKLNAIYSQYPDLRYSRMRMTKGGGSIVFVFDNKYLFKIRKFKNDNARFFYEKRITDAVAHVINIAVPHIELVKIGEYTFYKAQFIHGVNLMTVPLKKIYQNREKIASQLTEIIYKMFNANYPELADLKPDKNNIGLVHGDMCSNIIVNPDTMDIVGIIDWEWAGFKELYYEFYGLFRVRRKMRLTDVAPMVIWGYYNRQNKK